MLQKTQTDRRLKPPQHVVVLIISTAPRECSCSMENHGAFRLLTNLEIAKLSPDAAEMPASKMRLPFAEPMSSTKMTVAGVRQAMGDAGVLPPAAKVVLFFKNEEGDFVNLPSPEVAWPSCCISYGVLKAWFMCMPEAPATTPSKRGWSCCGPQVHRLPKNKSATLDKAGYSLLAAARDGCVSCVKYWLDFGVNANFESSNNKYTAIDFAVWAEEEFRISISEAEQVIKVLVAAGGRANER